MAKVIFEFNDEEENDDINIIVNRHKIFCTLYELDELYRKIYNGKIYDKEACISVKDNKVLTQEDYDKSREKGELYIEGTKSYLSQEFVEQELDRILEDIRMFLI